MSTLDKGALAAAVADEVAWEEAAEMLEAEIDMLAADAAAHGGSADRLAEMRETLAWYRRELAAATARRQEAEERAGGWPADWE